MSPDKEKTSATNVPAIAAWMGKEFITKCIENPGYPHHDYNDQCAVEAVAVALAGAKLAEASQPGRHTQLVDKATLDLRITAEKIGVLSEANSYIAYLDRENAPSQQPGRG